MAHDTKLDGPGDLPKLVRTMMPIPQIQATLRANAAASVLILDTNFNDVEKLSSAQQDDRR